MGIEQNDEDAAFEASFNATDESTPAPAAPVQQPAADGTPAVQSSAEEQPAEEAPDPFAGLPPAFKALFEGVRNDLTSTRNELASTRSELATAKALVGKVPALQSEIAKLKAPPPPAPEKPRYDKVEKLRAEGLPEVADAIEELAERLRPTTAPPAPAAPEPQEASTDPAEVELESAMQRLARVRPSWVADKDSPEFQGWLIKQPAAYQDELKSTRDPLVFLDSLSRWDRDRAQPATRSAPAPTSRTQRVAAAVTPSGAGRAARPVLEEDEDAAFARTFNSR